MGLGSPGQKPLGSVVLRQRHKVEKGREQEFRGVLTRAGGDVEVQLRDLERQASAKPMLPWKDG